MIIDRDNFGAWFYRGTLAEIYGEIFSEHGIIFEKINGRFSKRHESFLLRGISEKILGGISKGTSKGFPIGKRKKIEIEIWRNRSLNPQKTYKI